MGHEKTCKNFNIYSVVFFLKNKSTKDLDDDLQFFRYRVWQTEIGSYGSFFSPFPHPLKIKKSRILKKWKKILEISSFYTSVAWCIVPEIWSSKNNFLSFWAIFWPFTPLKTPKNQNFGKMKKPIGEIIILHMCTKNHGYMLYCCWDMVHD